MTQYLNDTVSLCPKHGNEGCVRQRHFCVIQILCLIEPSSNRNCVIQIWLIISHNRDLCHIDTSYLCHIDTPMAARNLYTNKYFMCVLQTLISVIQILAWFGKIRLHRLCHMDTHLCHIDTFLCHKGICLFGGKPPAR